jgi:hypothetical protein
MNDEEEVDSGPKPQHPIPPPDLCEAAGGGEPDTPEQHASL